MRAILLLTIPLLLAMSGSPSDVDCEEPVHVTGWMDSHQCYYPPGEPYSHNDLAHPLSYVEDVTEPKPKLRIYLHGWTDKPVHCTNQDSSKTGYVVGKPCADYWPDYLTNNIGLSWWGGDNNGWKIGLAVDRAYRGQFPKLDWTDGWEMSGTSMGGTGVILQALSLQDWFYRGLLTYVRSDIGITLFTQSTQFEDQRVQNYYVGYDLDRMDFQVQAAAGNLDHIFWRINGSPQDNLVDFDLTIFDYCDQYQLACMGTWHDDGHSPGDPNDEINYAADYPAEWHVPTYSKMLPVFTYASSNMDGHYNVGLSAHMGGYFIDADAGILVPLNYKALSTQPSESTFTFTLRRIKHFPMHVGQQLIWSMGEQSGIIQVNKIGELTIDQLTLQDSAGFSGLYIREPT